MFRFEKLDVWQKAIEFADRVYSVTRSIPNEERFGLPSQLRRAAVSVSSNIAEGSDRDFARFLEIAYGSLMEVVSQLNVSKRQEFVTDEEYDGLYEDAERLARMLSGLMSSINKRIQSQ